MSDSNTYYSAGPGSPFNNSSVTGSNTELEVLSGRHAFNDLVGGGLVIVDGGGYIQNTTVASGSAGVTVNGQGSAVSSFISGGSLDNNGGFTLQSLIVSGGFETVSDGTNLNDATVQGVTLSAQVQAGGSL